MRSIVGRVVVGLALGAAVASGVAGCSASQKVPGKQDTIHQAIVPDVVGRTQQGALSALADAGFVRGTIGTAPVSARSDGIIVEQRPAPGRRLRVGSSVDMTLGVAAGK